MLNVKVDFFSILFKQINIYSREINRLNKIISESKENNKHLLVKDSIIKSLRESEMRLEKCLSERIESENKLRIENSQLKKENEEYKKKLNELKENRLMSEITKAESNEIEIVNKEMLSDCKKTSEILKPMKIRIKELEKELGIKKQKYEKKENQKTQI